MIHDLMLPITGTSGDAHAISAGTALASALGAHLAVVQPITLPLPIPGPWGVAPRDMLDEFYAQLRSEAAKKAELVRSQLAKESISWEVRVDEGMFVEAPRAVARQARYADLAVLAAPHEGADEAPVSRAFFSALLFESGRPVLVVPAQRAVEFPFRHAVVAWLPSREATRAVHDALPLLTRFESVDVVTLDPVVGDMDHGPDPGVDIATHLARHGLNVNVRSIASSGLTVAAALLQHARESGAQLLVAGGYGHSRLREWALGGTTRELLHSGTVPVLFSH